MRVQTSLDRGVSILLNGYQQSTQRLQDTALRLSTGLNLPRPGDNPSAQFTAAKLRAQIGTVDTLLGIGQNGIDLLDTADNALLEIENLVERIRNSVLTAQNSSDIDEISTAQQQVDSALTSIDQLSGNAVHGKRYLLNGNSALKASGLPAAVKDLTVYSANPGGTGSTQNFTFALTSPGSRASVALGAAGNVAAMGGAVTARVTGPFGTVDIDLLAGQTNSQFGNLVNNNASSTGVAAVIGANVNLFSTLEGSRQNLNVSQVGGAGTFVPGTLNDSGTDLQGSVNGFSIQTDGNLVRAVGPNFSLKFEYDPGAGGASPFNFSVLGGSGLEFKFGPKGQDSEYVGIPSVTTSQLGSFSRLIGTVQAGGFLSDLQTGGTASLLTDPNRAATIADNALGYVQNLRSVVQGNSELLFGSQKNFLEALGSRLETSRSRIEDLDFASETALKTEIEIMRQVQVASIASIQLNARTVFDLLKTGDIL